MCPDDAPARRIAPLPADRWDERERSLAARVPEVLGPGVPHVVGTLLHHPDLMEALAPFSLFLLTRGRLPHRERELLILCTVFLAGARYEWSRHVPLARSAGLRDAEIRRIPRGPGDPAWSDPDRDLLRAAHELHRGARLSERTWEALAARYDQAGMIEITMLAGHYRMFAYLLNSAGTELDPGFTSEAMDSSEGE
ncbi:carboxymuconolactone decarboxylase family protein [Kitasatospora sp. NPDC056783]|uniref:carboxymuconolactone decarboxylase family protein n=1 Tax=Kitasatospora sp. NPDC056783 TaxID=3345943 RepID=UPI0036A739AE